MGQVEGQVDFLILDFSNVRRARWIFVEISKSWAGDSAAGEHVYGPEMTESDMPCCCSGSIPRSPAKGSDDLGSILRSVLYGQG
jgi:hypothetical protein